MEKYLYLTKKEWEMNWLNGGEIPISLASHYISSERSGIMTPDENRIHESTVDLTKLQLFKFSDNASIPNFTIRNMEVDGVKVPDIIDARYELDDGLILSFCNEKSKDIALKLNKKACVKILDINKLKQIIDTQLGVIGDMVSFIYTNNHTRNHFTKSNDDALQSEYRLFWKHNKNENVILPKGIAEAVELEI